jgi:general secretion pathway protein L
MSETSNSTSLPFFSMGDSVTGWARKCVAALMDDLAASAATAANCRTMILATAGGMEIFRRGKQGNWARAAILQGSPASLADALGRQLKGGKRRHVLLRIAIDRAVIQRLRLPAGALEVLPAVIRNKIESLAPWPVNEAMWGHRLMAPPHSGQIEVEAAIVSRQSGEALLATLAEAGIKPDCLEIGPADPMAEGIAIDFQEANRGRASRLVLGGVMAVVAAIALGISGYGAYLYYQSATELARIESQIEELNQSLRGASSGSGMPAKLAEANKIYMRKSEGRPTVTVLNALTRLLPDGVWLNSLDYGGNQITIAGRGDEIPGIIGKLETSEEFSSVNFASATQRDQEAGADSFAISASIDGKGTGQ